MLLKRGMGNGEWGMGNGEWGMGNGEWGMGNGEWGMGNGEWGMGNGEWGMGNGEWGMGNGEWGMGNGNGKWEWEIENGKLIIFVSLFHYLKLYLLLPGWSVRLVKNCDRGLENVASAASGSIFQA